MTAALLMSTLLAALLAASAFFSGSETALFSLSRHQRARLARDPSVVARSLLTLLQETRGLLITLLLGNMLVNVLYFALSSALMLRVHARLGLPAWLLAPLALAPLLAIVLFGEVLPKLTAARASESFARVVALPLLTVHRVVGPVRRFAAFAVIGPLARLLTPATATPDLDAEELAALLELSRERGVIDRDEQTTLDRVLELGRLRVRHLMVPRVDVRGHDLTDPPERLTERIRETRLRHLPAFTGSLDSCAGVLHSKEVLLRRPATPAAVAALVRPVAHVPELLRADRALLELRRRGRTFALVVDEYGGTAGLLTLEDLVEHLVGDLPGAYEGSDDPAVRREGPGRYEVDADLPAAGLLRSLAGPRHAHGVTDGSATGPATVGGLLMARLGRVAVAGDRVLIGRVRLTVRHVAGHRIETVGVELTDRGHGPARPPRGTAAAPTTVDTARPPRDVEP